MFGLLLLIATDPVLALEGLDPVVLVEGTERPGASEWSATHGSFRYRFATEANRDRFLADPERFGVQWGGACARMGPLSGLGAPDRFVVHEGRIFLFASDTCRAGFLREPERYVVPASPPEEFSAEELAAGRRLVASLLAAHGGADALANLGRVRFARTVEVDGWEHRLEQVFEAGTGLERASTWTPPADQEDIEALSTRWSVGETASVDRGEGAVPITSPAQLEDLRRFALREPLCILVELAADPDALVAMHDPGELHWRAHGLDTTLRVDPLSRRLVGILWDGRLIDGRTQHVVETFAGERRVGDLVVPAERTVLVDGEPAPSKSWVWDEIVLQR